MGEACEAAEGAAPACCWLFCGVEVACTGAAGDLTFVGVAGKICCGMAIGSLLSDVGDCSTVDPVLLLSAMVLFF